MSASRSSRFMGTFVDPAAAPEEDTLLAGSSDAPALSGVETIDLGSVRSSAPSALNSSAHSSARSSIFGSSLTLMSSLEPSAARLEAAVDVVASVVSALTLTFRLKEIR